MKQTKEQLIEEITKLRQSHEWWTSGDERRRKEFAKAFRWHEKPKPYSGAYNEPPEPILPTWEQIWVNLGTLLAARNFMDLEGNVNKMEMKLRELEDKITEKKPLI